MCAEQFASLQQAWKQEYAADELHYVLWPASGVYASGTFSVGRQVAPFTHADCCAVRKTLIITQVVLVHHVVNVQCTCYITH